MGALVCVIIVAAGFALVSAAYRKMHSLNEDYQYYVQENRD